MIGQSRKYWVERYAERWARDPEFARLVRRAHGAPDIGRERYWSKRVGSWVARQTAPTRDVQVAAGRLAAGYIVGEDRS